jgi:hypothetical protein
MAYQDYSDLKDEYKTVIEYCRSLKVGNKIKFKNEKQRYTVQAKSERFIVCTKPFNARKTYLYTIVDLKRIVRGAVGLVFGLTDDVNSPEEAQECINDLENGEYEVSHRNCVKLDVDINV